ncbi:hypothetical protein ACTXT7_013748 [Hymenolepis weldensis]
MSPASLRGGYKLESKMTRKVPEVCVGARQLLTEVGGLSPESCQRLSKSQLTHGVAFQFSDAEKIFANINPTSPTPVTEIKVWPKLV